MQVSIVHGPPIFALDHSSRKCRLIAASEASLMSYLLISITHTSFIARIRSYHSLDIIMWSAAINNTPL